jgi:hypothetical protein
MNLNWTVSFTHRAAKQVEKLSEEVLAALRLLVEDLCTQGAAVPEWPNYGKLYGRLSQDKRHCHLIKGRPTWVCCWQVVDKNVKIMEIYYIGTHENAPY